MLGTIQIVVRGGLMLLGTVLALALPVNAEAADPGVTAFERHCASCHGKNAAGTDKGPTFIHRVYHPGHHGDAAFAIAVRRGVRQHHWRFGDMKPVPDVTDEELMEIVRYVRKLQKANGIN